MAAASADPKPEDMERLTQEWDSRLDSPPPSRSTNIAAAVVAGLLVLVFVVCFGFFIVNRPAQHHGIILFIGDGFGPASATLARTMLNRSLSLDAYLVGTVKTSSASSLITDSAAAATAYACGEKTNNLWVSVLPDGTPCKTLLEAAQEAGWRVGLIATTDLTDATPAAFSAHVNGRDDMAGIAAQQIAHKIDVMIGGGSSWFTPLAAQAAEAGITLTYNWADVRDHTVAMPFIAALTPSRMPYMIDRPADTTLPTLKDCFEAAIDYLTRDSDKPFFLMVEGSRIDHAGHGNDAAAQWQEVAAFESAFAAAAKYATSHTGVALVSTADHETGGLTIGRDPGEFTKAPEYAWHPEVLRAVNASAERIAAAIPNANAADILSVVFQFTGIYVDNDEADYIIRGAAAGAKANAIGRVISRRAGLAWTTMGHTGVDVNLYAAGAVPRFHGNYDNTQVGRAIAALHKFQIGRVPK